MKSLFRYIRFFVCCTILLCNNSCTKHFEEYNTDGNAYLEEQQKYDNYWYAIPMVSLQKGIYFNYDWGGGKNWPFQIMQNLNIDLFAGYFHNTNFKVPYINSRYDLNDTWNGSLWENTYWYIASEAKKAENRNKDTMPEFYAITQILKVEILHRIADVYGPIMYKEFANAKLGGNPDSQREAYYAFFKDLELAIELLSKNVHDSKFKRFDILMPENKRNNLQWIKFANSLRLRLAMRISKVEPDSARAQALKSIESPFGLLETIDDIVAVSTINSGYTNPLGEINKSWGEVFMNANMESILTGYDDPRKSHFFETATDKELKLENKYKGVRQGTDADYSRYNKHSRSQIDQSADALLMTSAEVWFLRAEASLRGWTEESARDCYEAGIKASFALWKVEGVDKYLQNDNTASDYIDPIQPDNSIKARCKVSPQWDEGATKEEKLEKIITQKWLACYPEGCEAWAEQRRTGYPRLFPVKVNKSNGTIDSEVFIRRLNFPVSIQTSNPELYTKLCEKLEGEDNGGTRLWWDTGKGNFPTHQNTD